MSLPDMEWLRIMIDLEDMEEYDTLRTNIRLRPHLTDMLRALQIKHLEQIN